MNKSEGNAAQGTSVLIGCSEDVYVEVQIVRRRTICVRRRTYCTSTYISYLYVEVQFLYVDVHKGKQNRLYTRSNKTLFELHVLYRIRSD